MSLTVIQTINININKLSEFPKERIDELISELNVHYNKINAYIEANVDQEKINDEVINSLAKLQEIDRLVPRRIPPNSMNNDFKLGVDLLESIIALLNTLSGHESTRRKLWDLGWNLLHMLYSFTYDVLVSEALLYNWLKRFKLVQSNALNDRYGSPRSQNGEKIKFSPSEEEIDMFFDKHKAEIYQYMVFKMSEDNLPSDPFHQAGAADFYHYYQTLSNVSVRPKSAA